MSLKWTVRFTALAVLLSCAASSQAAIVTWNVDSAASFVRLNIADQSFPLEGFGDVTIQLRDRTNINSWTDAGGRQAPLAGSFQTNYAPSGASIDFLSSSIEALETRTLRPNPAAFNPASTDADNPDGQYSNTTNGTYALGARTRGIFFETFTLDVGYLGIKDIDLAISSGVVPIAGGTPTSGGTIAGSSTDFGLTSAKLFVDGIVTALGQVIPDIYEEALPGTLSSTNTGAATIVSGHFGALGNRKLTYTVDAPISLEVGDIIVSGTVTGQVVAYTTFVVPEPSAMILGGTGALALAWQLARRRGSR